MYTLYNYTGIVKAIISENKKISQRHQLHYHNQNTTSCCFKLVEIFVQKNTKKNDDDNDNDACIFAVVVATHMNKTKQTQLIFNK